MNLIFSVSFFGGKKVYSMENFKNAFKETQDLVQDLSLFSSQWIDNKNISEKRRRIYSSKYHMVVIKEDHPIN